MHRNASEMDCNLVAAFNHFFGRIFSQYANNESFGACGPGGSAAERRQSACELFGIFPFATNFNTESNR